MEKYGDNEEYRYSKELQDLAGRDTEIITRPKIGMTADEVREIWGNPSI
jgi:outer membrane protein assembly factor BamE (lipoprotein component of BamABCDE complex)